MLHTIVHFVHWDDDEAEPERAEARVPFMEVPFSPPCTLAPVISPPIVPFHNKTHCNSGGTKRRRRIAVEQGLYHPAPSGVGGTSKASQVWNWSD